MVKMRWDDFSGGFSTGKGTQQGCKTSPVEFNMHAEDKMRILENVQHGIKVGGRLNNKLCYADGITLLTITEHDGIKSSQREQGIQHGKSHGS